MEVVADWFDTDKLIAAAETEDEVGVVLRMHLAADKVIDHYLVTRITTALGRYIKIPKYSSQKLTLAAAFGLPIPFLAACHELNQIRNGLAHDDDVLKHDKVQQFARQVDSIVQIDPAFHPVAKRWVTFPRVAPGEKMAFGTAGVRVDFIIASFVLVATMAKWIATQDVAAAV